MKTFNAALFGLSLTMSQLGFAAEVTPNAIPKNLHVYSESGGTYVDHIPTGCAEQRYYLNPNHLKYNTLVSILLAAQMGQKNVQIRFDGCNADGKGKIVGVYLK